jgi:prophage antirepressor-like protein
MHTHQTTTHLNAARKPGEGSPSTTALEPRQGWRERYAAYPKATSRLNYQGRLIRAHVTPDGTPWVVLVDIFRALEVRNPAPLRKRIKDPKDIMQVLAWVPNAATPAGGGAMIKATNAAGLGHMLSVSDEKKARDLYGWLIATGLPEVQAGG